jgi:SAM-dependent methyltransferase
VRKDYLPVDPATATLDEASFVEQYWTGQWRDRSRPPDVSQVARFEEYGVMAPYLARLPRGSRILDGGCGMGEWTVYLAQQGFDVTGIDISEETVARLKTWFPASAFMRADLRQTTFADASFDAYFSWGTFEHFENGLGDCIGEARRLLRPGGWLFVSVPYHNLRMVAHDAGGFEWRDQTRYGESGFHHPQRFYQWRLTQDELRRELEIHGFRVDRVRRIHKDTGAGRLLQRDVGMLARNTLRYRIVRRLVETLLPSTFISHMILAAAERR